MPEADHSGFNYKVVTFYFKDFSEGMHGTKILQADLWVPICGSCGRTPDITGVMVLTQ